MKKPRKKYQPCGIAYVQVWLTEPDVLLPDPGIYVPNWTYHYEKDIPPRSKLYACRGSSSRVVVYDTAREKFIGFLCLPPGETVGPWRAQGKIAEGLPEKW